MTTVANYDALQTKKAQLLRKAKTGSLFAATYASTGITALTSGAGSLLQTLPTGYKDVGFISTDGATYGRDTTISDVNSFGSNQPTRSDFTKDSITCAATLQETNAVTMGMWTGVDTSALQAAFTTGEVSISKPNLPTFRYYRLLGLFVDTDDNGLEIYMARYMPRARITSIGEQKYGGGDSPVETACTFTGFDDSVAGYSHRWIWGGPGWLPLITAMGFTQATS